MPGPVVLVDAGALIALFNKTDSEHQFFRRFFAYYYGEALTTWPVLTEAEHLVEKYADRPTGLADASLVWSAEHTGVHEIVTTDRKDFEFYRMRSGHALRILPPQN